MLRDYLHVERPRSGDARAEAGEYDLVDIGDFDEHRLLGDEEYIFLEHKEVALHSFQIRFEPRVPVAAGHVGRQVDRWGRAKIGCTSGKCLR